MNEHEQIIEREQGRWQDAIYGVLTTAMKDVPAEHQRTIDGAGCESGDPMDVSLAEIGLAISAHNDWAHANDDELATLRTRIATLERENAAMADLIQRWVETTSGNHMSHWDRTMQGGKGCEQCIAESAMRKSSRDLLATDAARASTKE